MNSRRTRAAAVLAALAAAVLWGTTGTAQALGPAAAEPTAVGALRVVVGALALVALALPWRRWSGGRPAQTAQTGQRRAGSGAPSASGWLARAHPAVLVAAGGVAVAAYQLGFFVGVARTGVAVGTVVALGIAPLATGLAGLLLAERPTARWVAATGAAVVGVGLLVAGSGGGTAAGVDLIGVAAAAGAGVAYAGYTVTARALLLRGWRGIRVIAAFFALGALLLLPLLVGADLRWVVSTSGVAMVAWLGLVATALSYALFQRGLSGLPAGTVATLSLAEPVTAALLGVLVLREQISGLSATGMLVVVLGLLLVTVAPHDQKSAKSHRRGEAPSAP